MQRTLTGRRSPDELAGISKAFRKDLEIGQVSTGVLGAGLWTQAQAWTRERAYTGYDCKDVYVHSRGRREVEKNAAAEVARIQLVKDVSSQWGDLESRV